MRDHHEAERFRQHLLERLADDGGRPGFRARRGEAGDPSDEGHGRHGHGHGGRGGPRGGRGRRGEWREGPEAPAVSAEAITAWLAGRLPDAWFTGTPEVTVDRDEILVVGTLADVPARTADDDTAGEAEAGRISRFREETRDERIAVAREAEHRYGRRIAWGAVAGETRETFTALAVPVMTRLRQPERVVLDTLVDAGVARSRSDALAWCVRLTGRNTDEWLGRLREAMTSVEQVRAEGPTG